MTTSPPLIPPAAAARLLAGDVNLLIQGLQRGLRVDAHWPDWECPLLHGVCIFSPSQAADMVEAILGAGASMTEEYRGMTPVLCALGGFNRETGDPLGARLAMIKTLQKADPAPNVELWAMVAVRIGYKDALAHFLDSGCSIDAATEGGHTLLHEAYACKDTEIGRYLVSRGARTDVKNQQGKTPSEAVQPSSEDAVPRGEIEGLQAIDLAIRTLGGGEDDMPEPRHPRL